MLTLKGEHVFLRALEPSDIELLCSIENDETLWELSHTQQPFSRFILQSYLENSHKDIYEAKQLRLVIESYEKSVVGLIDLFDFDPKNKRVGVGIVIQESYRQSGFGLASLQLLVNFAFKHLHVRQIYANILEDNVSSIKLFKQLGFKEVGLKQDWVFDGEAYKNEFLFQLIK